MQIICTLLQRNNHAGTSPLSYLQAGCLSGRPTNSIKALKKNMQWHMQNIKPSFEVTSTTTLAQRTGRKQNKDTWRCNVHSLNTSPMVEKETICLPVTFDSDFQTWPRQGQDGPACPLSRSTVIYFKSDTCRTECSTWTTKNVSKNRDDR